MDQKQEVNGGEKKTASSEQTPSTTSAVKSTEQKTKAIAKQKGGSDKAAEVT